MKSFYGLIVFGLLLSPCFSDTFKHKETGETFTGFPTQKSTGSQSRVYNSESKKFVTVDLAEYEVERNAQGRRNNVIVVPITQPESLISKTVAQQIAEAIVDGSNAGPLAVLVTIDSPGGSGENMKIITNAISQTRNCPVAAYITGGTYGGAFNSAAVAALACDKIFIAPSASMGAVGPIADGIRSSMDYGNYMAVYAPDSLVTYSTFVSALAQEHKRPSVLARGLIDKKLSIIEVTNVDGSRDFVLKGDRQPAQTVVRTVSEGMSGVTGGSDDASASTESADIAASVLNLTAEEAVKSGLADEIAASRKEVLASMQVPDAQLVSVQGIDATIKKFTAAKRNIAEGLAQIERLEADVELLDTHFKQVQEQLRTGTQTREVYQQEVGGRTARRTRFPNYEAYYHGSGNVADPYGRDEQRRYPSTRERVTSLEPLTSPEAIQGQLNVELRQLIGEYRRVINMAKRWPGILPPDLPISSLQSNLDSANAQLDNLYRVNSYYPNQVAPNQLGRRGY